MRKQFTILIICLIVLAACGERGKLGLVTTNIPTTKHKNIYVATTRQRDGTAYGFSGLRTSELSYARYGISIPPTHVVGEIEWPKGPPDQATDFVVTDAQIFKTQASFSSKIRATKAADGVVVFIHGYNNNFAESLYRFAQLSSDIGFKSTPILYAWPTTETSYEYLHDRDSVLFARDGLQTLLEQIASSGVKRLTLVAHSIGSNLLMETLRQMAIGGDQRVAKIIDAVVLLSPDIDQSVFQLQLSRLNPVPSPFIVFASENDRALRVMSFLTGNERRLGQITYSDALAKQGVQVVNLSGFTDGDALNHSVALTSPSVIAIIKKVPAARALSKRNGGNPEGILQRLFKPK
jgi:esterase/lipase superfamily enzyme